jgi:hypothetical protein
MELTLKEVMDYLQKEIVDICVEAHEETDLPMPKIGEQWDDSVSFYAGYFNALTNVVADLRHGNKFIKGE